jgi:hypothetical protein
MSWQNDGHAAIWMRRGGGLMAIPVTAWDVSRVELEALDGLGAGLKARVVEEIFRRAGRRIVARIRGAVPG